MTTHATSNLYCTVFSIHVQYSVNCGNWAQFFDFDGFGAVLTILLFYFGSTSYFDIIEA